MATKKSILESLRNCYKSRLIRYYYESESMNLYHELNGMESMLKAVGEDVSVLQQEAYAQKDAISATYFFDSTQGSVSVTWERIGDHYNVMVHPEFDPSLEMSFKSFVRPSSRLSRAFVKQALTRKG